jgi:hypothetical protein
MQVRDRNISMISRESTKTMKGGAKVHSDPFGPGRDKPLSASILGEARRKGDCGLPKDRNPDPQSPEQLVVIGLVKECDPGMEP